QPPSRNRRATERGPMGWARIVGSVLDGRRSVKILFYERLFAPLQRRRARAGVGVGALRLNTDTRGWRHRFLELGRERVVERGLGPLLAARSRRLRLNRFGGRRLGGRRRAQLL